MSKYNEGAKVVANQIQAPPEEAGLNAEFTHGSVEGSLDSSQVSAVVEVATQQEIWGWYMFDWANSPFFQVADILFVLLQTRLAEMASSFPKETILPGSYSSVIRGINNVCQVIALLSFSAFADYGSNRLRLLKRLSWAACCILFLTLSCASSAMWWNAGLLRVLAGQLFALTTVYINAYLPLLAAAHPEVVNLEGVARMERSEKASADMSNKGFFVGYLGGMCCAILAVVVLAVTGSSACADADSSCGEVSSVIWLCLCIASVGIWWFSFASYTFRHLKPRPGPAFPENQHIFAIGWVQSWQVLCLLRKYRHTLFFLISYFFASDAVATFQNLAPLVLSTLNTDSEDEDSAPVKDWTILLFSGIIGPLVGALGGFALLGVQQRFQLKPKVVVLSEFAVLGVTSIICGIGFIQGFLTYMAALAPLALIQASLSANLRSVYGRLIPTGMEAAMFALFAITDKGSAVVGPQVTAVVYNSTQAYDHTFWYCLLAFILAGVFLSFSNIEQGEMDAKEASVTSTLQQEACPQKVGKPRDGVEVGD